MSAWVSDDQLYRYSLERSWGGQAPLIGCMLNPSKADAEINDPTIRRFIGFAKLYGCGGLLVGNAYGLRSTEPKELWRVDDPVGQENDRSLCDLFTRQSYMSAVVVAWGTVIQKERAKEVLDLIQECGKTPMCFGTTKQGFPRHPLYLPKNTKLQKYTGV